MFCQLPLFLLFRGWVLHLAQLRSYIARLVTLILAWCCCYSPGLFLHVPSAISAASSGAIAIICASLFASGWYGHWCSSGRPVAGWALIVCESINVRLRRVSRGGGTPSDFSQYLCLTQRNFCSESSANCRWDHVDLQRHHPAELRAMSLNSAAMYVLSDFPQNIQFSSNYANYV